MIPNKSRIAEDDCEIDVLAKHRELVQQLFVVLGQAKKINKLVQRAKEDESASSNLLAGGEVDLYLTLCRIQKVYKDLFEKEVNKKIQILNTPGMNGWPLYNTNASMFNEAKIHHNFFPNEFKKSSTEVYEEIKNFSKTYAKASNRDEFIYFSNNDQKALASALANIYKRFPN